MDKQYDYSRHKFCISLVFDYNTLTSKTNDTDGYFASSQDTRYREKTQVPSFLYDTISKTVIARDGSYDQLICETEEAQENLFYVHNVFAELYNNYLRLQEKPSEKNAFDDLVQQEAIDLLKLQVNYWIKELDCSTTEFCYAFSIPSHWSDNTIEELIQPLFLKSGLINKDDVGGRLIFFTELELTFRYLQSEDHYRRSVEMNQGHQYVIMSLEFQQELHVDLQLVSAQYPGLKTVDSRYIPQLLKNFYFTIPFGFQNVKSSLTACLEKLCDPILALEIIDQMLETINEQFERMIERYDHSFESVLSLQPFENFKYVYDPQYSKNKFNFDIVRSLTLEDILEGWFHSVEKTFMNGMYTLLLGTDNVKARSLIISCAECFQKNRGSVAVLKLVEKWAKACSEEQDSSYELNANNECYSYCFSVQEKLDTFSALVKNQMEEYNRSRDPIILPRDLTTEQSGSSSKPVYFFNIDLMPTRNKITLTYMDEKNKVKQTKTIDCDIKPLDTFFKQSESYQRPHLHISNRLKIQLEKMFAVYLIIYSKLNREKTSSRLTQPEIKTTFGSCFGIKTSKNWPKEIRNFFASSSPHLLEQVMQNVKMDDIFMNNSSRSDKTDVLITSDPGYILFFILAYLHSLNILLDKELNVKFGNDWRGENIWYGVSVDKHLLETVFVSKKKLEKLFYASGILLKDNNLRRAKFNVRGEEILPAIQKILDLNLKMKSYFAVAQIFPQYVQLTLHQTVKLASSEEDAATIVIEDKIVYFDDVYDELCQNIWKNMQSNCQIDYCITHKGKKNEEFDFGSFQAYRVIRQTLMQQIAKLLKNNGSNLDMDLCTKLNINNNCTCLMRISLRLITEIGLQPVIKRIVTTIAASLTNYDLFGNYKTDYLFVLGDPFDLSYNSPFYTVYTTIIQRAMDDGIHSKGKDTQAFVMKYSLSQLLDMFKMIKPHMFGRFINGTLCQVPNNTYGVRLYLERCYPFSRVNRNGDIKNDVEGQGDYLIFIEKGKPLSTTGTMIKIKGEKISSTFAYIIRTRHLGSNKLKKYDTLDATANGSWEDVYSGGQTPSAYDLIVEYKHLNYDYSLEFTMRRMIDYDYGGNPTKFWVLGEPLTLAYI